MHRRITAASSVVILLLLTTLASACGSMNRQTPKQWDDKTIEADVRSKIATVDPKKTFAIEISVNDGVVTLDGHADNDNERSKIVEAAQSVNGVKRVIDNIHVM